MTACTMYVSICIYLNDFLSNVPTCLVVALSGPVAADLRNCSSQHQLDNHLADMP